MPELKETIARLREWRLGFRRGSTSEMDIELLLNAAEEVEKLRAALERIATDEADFLNETRRQLLMAMEAASNASRQAGRAQNIVMRLYEQTFQRTSQVKEKADA